MLNPSTQFLASEKKAEAIERIRLQLIRDDRIKAGIQCFDVNNDGMVALAFQAYSRGWIYVYNADGEFQYGFRFITNGDFGIDFYQEHLAIYFARGNMIAIYDSMGNCIDIREEPDSKLNSYRFREILNRSHKEMNGKWYTLERDVPFFDSYSRCVVVNDQGVKTVLYDVSVMHNIVQIARLTGLVCFFAFVIRGIIKKLMSSEE